jgi:4-hydroxy-3-methylbut-2-enyl diphosphate reductase LytB-like protein
MAAQCDPVIVVGSRNSSNSVRMVEVACQRSVGAVHLIDHAGEIGFDSSWLVEITSIGLTSGASVPDILLTGVIEQLADYGCTEVEGISAEVHVGGICPGVVWLYGASWDTFGLSYESLRQPDPTGFIGLAAITSGTRPLSAALPQERRRLTELRRARSGSKDPIDFPRSEEIYGDVIRTHSRRYLE